MRAYCGQTREMGLVRKLEAHGIGECTVRGELRSRKRDPWFYDNGAFRDWRSGRPFNGLQFSRDMRRIRYSKGSDATPDFIVAPDLVAQGEASLEFTSMHRLEIGELPTYLAVQDGMSYAAVRVFLDSADAEELPYAGIFVGGSLDWKLATAAHWVELAHELGLRCHVGRVGTPERIRWAKAIGVDSIDSCLPLMYEEHLGAFLGALEEVRAS